ncbi:helix-turn-helix domain-containing protein [Streptomyces sp. NBC_01465]|uniref:helix-turn-helix domain-containing protein n=1 Tax=Streptomyces sp. NBC_01465 TaxID=2903878 RepID=UPI002E33EDB7|nr:helix-turn-helix transcriptional regulator [Streptomyces sp. NBC_01465]
MPPRSQPTARQMRLGVELRKLREAAGLTAREAAELMSVNSIQVSQIESGRAGVSEVRLRRLAALYACADTELIDALVELAVDRTRGWWEEYRGVLPSAFLDLSELEHHARFLRVIGTAHVPGILQTEDYARAVFSYMTPELPMGELDSWIAHRAHRRIALDREAPFAYEAVIHEAALRVKVADRAVARAQLAQISTLMERPNVTVRVVPFEADGFGGANSSLMWAGGSLPRLDTVHRDTPQGSAFVDAEAQLVRARTLFRKVEDASLTHAASRDFIRKLVHEL